jgi:hypothetical protein
LHLPFLANFGNPRGGFVLRRVDDGLQWRLVIPEGILRFGFAGNPGIEGEAATVPHLQLLVCDSGRHHDRMARFNSNPVRAKASWIEARRGSVRQLVKG